MFHRSAKVRKTREHCFTLCLNSSNRKFARDKVLAPGRRRALELRFPGNALELRNLVEPSGCKFRPSRPGSAAAAARDVIVEQSLAEMVDCREHVKKLEPQMLHQFARSCCST